MRIGGVTELWLSSFLGLHLTFDLNRWPWRENWPWNINLGSKCYITVKYRDSSYWSVENFRKSKFGDLWPRILTVIFKIELSPIIGINANLHKAFCALFSENWLQTFWVIVEILKTDMWQKWKSYPVTHAVFWKALLKMNILVFIWPLYDKNWQSDGSLKFWPLFDIWPWTLTLAVKLTMNFQFR